MGSCGRSSMAEFQPSKLAMRVRFPSPALLVRADPPGSRPIGDHEGPRDMTLECPRIRLVPGAAGEAWPPVRLAIVGAAKTLMVPPAVDPTALLARSHPTIFT